MNSIDHDYQGSLKSQSFKQWELPKLESHENVNTRSEHNSPSVAGSILVNCNSFALIQFWQNCQNDLFKEKLDSPFIL